MLVQIYQQEKSISGMPARGLTILFHPIGKTILLLCFAIAPTSVAQAEPIAITSSFEYPPYMDAAIARGGLFTEITRVSFKATGKETSFTPLPSKRVYRAVLDGEYLAMHGWAHNDQRAADFHLSDPIYAYSDKLFTTLPDLKSWQQIHLKQNEPPLALCIPLGWIVLSPLQTLVDNGTLSLLTPEKLQSCFELLAVGRVQILTVPHLTLVYWQRKMSDEAIEPIQWPKVYRMDGPIKQGQTVHVMFTKNATGLQLKDEFNRGLKTILENGDYRKIVDRQTADYPDDLNQDIFKTLKSVGIIVQ